MTTRSRYGAEARPISHAGRDGRRLLEQVVITSEHADGRGTVHLTADQLLHVQSRLSQIAATFLPHHQSDGRHPRNQPTTHPEGSGVHVIAQCGAEAWPVFSDGMALPVDLEKVVVISAHANGRGPVHLSPEQALYVHERLSHIALDFLHDKGWGGEDARSQ